MSVPETVRRLVERFEEHRQSYLSGKYNEAQLRREFLDPFFKTLRPHAAGAGVAAPWGMHRAREGFAHVAKPSRLSGRSKYSP